MKVGGGWGVRKIKKQRSKEVQRRRGVGGGRMKQGIHRLLETKLCGRHKKKGKKGERERRQNQKHDWSIMAL